MRILLLGLQALYPLILFSADDKTERDAIQLAIPYIEEKGAEWIREKKCVSCHQVNSMLWSLSLSKGKGFKVSEKIERWINWAVGDLMRKNDKGQIIGQLNKEGVAQLLYGLPQLSDHDRTRLTTLLSPDQQPDGTWHAGGQLPAQHRPLRETTIVSTMWISLSTDEKVLAKVLPAIRKSEPGKSTEWYALRVLFAQKSGIGIDQTLKHARTLLDLQNKDGGWGWLTSDALGTGLALYALESIRAQLDPERLALARKFLISSQQKDGSWSVKGTKKKKRHKIEETSSY
jgi:hypothetical protein